MELTNKIKEKIKESALLNPNKECCGFILSNDAVIECKNRAEDSNVHFIITAGDIKKVRKKGNIVAVYHTHVPGDYEKNQDQLSKEDIIISEYFNVTSILYSLIEDKFYIHEPTGKPIDYIGRPYVRGVLDEFNLIKDYYKKELNIGINDFSNKNLDIFFKNNGFVQTNEIKKHDILIIKKPDIMEKKPAIFVGNNQIIIQYEFDSSKIVEYSYGMQKWTEKTYRHNKM